MYNDSHKRQHTNVLHRTFDLGIVCSTGWYYWPQAHAKIDGAVILVGARQPAFNLRDDGCVRAGPFARRGGDVGGDWCTLGCEGHGRATRGVWNTELCATDGDHGCIVRFANCHQNSMYCWELQIDQGILPAPHCDMVSGDQKDCTDEYYTPNLI